MLDGRTLQGKCILLVEDDFMVALDMQEFLEESGAEVVGPAPTLKRALELVEAEGHRLDAGVLDINLRGERSYPVADRLSQRGVIFVFTTGYHNIPERYAALPRCDKPVDKSRLVAFIAGKSPVLAP
jgi:DNA-binding NarL/FixJ family response regulator